MRTANGRPYKKQRGLFGVYRKLLTGEAMNYGLPEKVNIGEKEHAIRSDFRVILEILEALNDEELAEAEKIECLLKMFYVDWEDIEDLPEAVKACYNFIDGGRERPNKKSARLIDWERDFEYIIAPVNRVLGYEARAAKKVHWWTFLSAYMEIGGDCLMSQIVSIRDKQNKGKKLEKHEREWLRQNRHLVNLPQKYNAADNEMLRQLTGGV